ncbi:MAG: hypothetical protein DME02_19780 [Candidatus Rokuibacteriota bacterium]|nr:MAG: hypothetical protein DME02_19780 [Candidatus Rokubacteria bacterium]
MRHFVIGVLLALAVALPLTFVAPPTVPAEGDCRPIEDFAHAQIGEFPSDWKARKETGKSVYSVQEEGGKRFLRAVSRKVGIQAAREVQSWDLTTYPILAWSWRPREFPKGADERDERRNDSVLAVYMLVPHSRVAGPKAVKYIWSEKVPAGTRLASNGGLTQVRVLRSGTEGRGEWRQEKVNVLEDYRRYFDAKEPPKPIGIAVLTDSDETKSSAAGDYADFKVCRN